MLRIAVSIFVILHGLVHLLYFGHSRRAFELEKGMLWPEGAWLLSGFLKEDTLRNLAAVMLMLGAAIFTVSGIGLITKQLWWRAASIAALILSSLIFIIFWDGAFTKMGRQGLFALAINLGILIFALALKQNI